MELLFEFELEYDENSPLGKDPEKDWEILRDEIIKTDSAIDLTLIKKAFNFCIESHSSSKRKSGLPYYTHPLNVALILLREFPFHDTESIAASLLHDTVEDVEPISKQTIIDNFGIEIAEMVDAVTKISHEEFRKDSGKVDNTQITPENILKMKAATYRKLFLALVKDVRVVLIKLADRLHNLRTLHYLRPDRQRDISIETLNFYIPIAHRLGLGRIKIELENRSFYFSDRAAYEAIRTALNEKRRDFIDYIRVFADLIHNSLDNKNLNHTLSIVHKHEYEIYKMMQEGKSLSDIDNFYSVVIILHTDDIAECYRAHGVLANAFNTVSFVDYVANPKIDWYKSLNTELFGPDGKKVEILIRTDEMEKISEEGFASKFSLKTGRVRALEFSDKEIEEWGVWMEDIIEIKGEQSAKIIWDSIKVNLFDNELTVYSKDGMIITLPQGASLLDFAFAISEDIGMHCIAGKINSQFHDLKTKLNSGDVVDIISSPNSLPSPDWLEDVVSHRAVSKLHKYFKEIRNDRLDKPSNNDSFEIKLKITGEDRQRMLFNITDAIGKNNIKRINLDTTGSMFEGALIINVKGYSELNYIITKLLTIKGIKSVFEVDSFDNSDN